MIVEVWRKKDGSINPPALICAVEDDKAVEEFSGKSGPFGGRSDPELTMRRYPSMEIAREEIFSHSDPDHDQEVFNMARLSEESPYRDQYGRFTERPGCAGPNRVKLRIARNL